MSIEQLKDLFGNQDAILELVQLEGGALALRNAGSHKQPLVMIQFNDEVKALLGEQTPVIAQQMIQAALYGLLEQPLHVLAVVAIIMIGKTIAAMALVLFFRYPINTALTVGASLAQIGEFSFILAALGVSLNLLSLEGQNLILAG